MPRHTHASHTIRIAAPLKQCQLFFTPAGEELWVDGWNPTYLHPQDGSTVPGLVFTTGAGEDYTLWNMVDFDTSKHYARYARVTPALRTGTVEVQCTAVDEATTDVAVTYTLTALTSKGSESLASFEGPAFVAMIEEWKQAIDKHLVQLLLAHIR